MDTAVAKGVLLSLCVLAAGCSTIPDDYWPMSKKEAPSAVGVSGLRVLQIKEGKAGEGDIASTPGTFFKRDDFESINAWLASGGETPIIIYVHGWHHNATERKDNLGKFRQLIATIEHNLCDLGRKQQVANACPGVQGVYIGWRGDSLDPFLFPDKLDFPTFKSRKEASARVGVGDLATFIREVRDRYPDRNVIFAGHSLGANALYHAIKADGPIAIGDRHEYFLLNPATSSSEFGEVFAPAVAQTRASISSTSAPSPPIDLTSMILRRENRKIFILQAEGDAVVKHLYQPSFGKSIGFDESLRTHLGSASPVGDNCPALSPDPAPIDYCNITLESGLKLKPAQAGMDAAQCKALFAQPIWSVKVDRTVSKSHGDIWNPVERCAVAELIVKRIRQVPGY